MTWVDVIVNGVFNGTGTALGSYFATRWVIEHWLKPFEKKKEEKQ